MAEADKGPHRDRDLRPENRSITESNRLLRRRHLVTITYIKPAYSVCAEVVYRSPEAGPTLGPDKEKVLGSG